MIPKRCFSLILVLATFLYFPACVQSDPPGVRIVMLGDSITARGNWPALLKSNTVLNQGVDGDRTSDVLARLEKVYRLKPKRCLIMIGINDILSGQPVDKIFINYQKIIAGLLQRDINLIIQSTLFLAGSESQNKLVETLNRQIKNLAEERKLLYLDLNQRLAPNKQLLPAYTNDGLHLSDAGYQAWKDELLKSSAISLN